MDAQPQRFSTAVLSFLLTVAVWLTIAWPLPTVLDEAISVGISKRENPRINQAHMMPGDHLQFVYYMWIFSDYLSGKTPFFYNLYEFNTGSDAERFKPGSYYFPFSLAFSAFYAVGNRAFAWNMISLLTLWLAAYGTWRLCRRYTDHTSIAATASLLAILFPYQWVQLFGGSPAGFGMALVPLILLGLDQAVREDRMTGGWIAGLALFAASMTDTHAFFFGALMVPCWCLVAFTQRPSFAWRRPSAYARIAWALGPVAILAVASLLLARLGTRHIKQTAAAGGRRISEVALFSPKAEGLWAWHEIDVSYHIYFGYLIAALLVFGLLAWTWCALRKRAGGHGRNWVLMSLIALGITGVVLLSMGPFGPFEGRLFTAARKYIPQYTMIRQPAKIFVLLPALLALGTTLTLNLLRRAVPVRLRHLPALLVAAGFAVEYYYQSKVYLCFIDDRNAAYAAVAADAQAMQQPAHVVAVPLWPGDSHYASVYQHYVSLYRIRMINGYRPFVPQDYVDEVFTRFRSINTGRLTDQQIDELLGRGIHHVILHEDLFPEKVSPFPVATTLQGLLQHPRLTLLKQDGPIWSFRLEPTARPPATPTIAWDRHFPARRYEAERMDRQGADAADEATASGGRLVNLRPSGRINTGLLFCPALPDLRWSIRVRGKGVILASARAAGQAGEPLRIAIDEAGWAWHDVPLPAYTHTEDIQLALEGLEGSVQVDLITLLAGPWQPLAAGESVTLPAPLFFHAGAIDLGTDSVCFTPQRDRPDLIFYGPKLPLPPGRYEIAVDLDTQAPNGTDLGTWIVACPEGNEIGRLDLVAGGSAHLQVEVPDNLPLLCAFLYHGTTELCLQRIHLRRL